MSDQFATCLIHNDKEGEFHTCPVCLEVELSTLRTQLKSVEAERDEANAAAAVMRGWLEKIDCHCIPGKYQCFRCKALATEAGKSLLLRLQEAELLIGETMFNWTQNYYSLDWITRRDAFLNPKPQDVM